MFGCKFKFQASFAGMLLSDSLTSCCDTISLPMDNRSCLRRIARHEDALFSNQSIMNVIEKFVKAVGEMEETILVPCRLMDLKVGDAGDTVEVDTKKHQKGKRSIRDMANTDLYNLYTTVNSVKRELLWGQSEDVSDQGMITVPSSTSVSSATKGHARRPSTASMTSTNSSNSISDTDSENGNENDSGIEDSQAADVSQEVAANFRRHLHGLYRSLEQMTEAANYLTTRYQNDVGGAV